MMPSILGRVDGLMDFEYLLSSVHGKMFSISLHILFLLPNK